jgi:hypothetical protein
MTDLKSKIKDLEVKYKEQLKTEKTALMKKYREQEKKKQESELKKLFADFLKYRKFFNDDILLLGCLENGINAMNKGDQEKLDYFRGLVRDSSQQRNNQVTTS